MKSAIRRFRSARSSFRLAAIIPVPAILAAAIAITGPAAAQVAVGGHGAYQTEIFDGTFGAGARLEVDLGFLRRGISLAGTWETYFPGCDDCSLWEAGGQVIVSGENPIYLGLGGSFQRFERGSSLAELGDTDDWIFNLVFGFRLRVMPVITPFMEVRQEFGSESANQQTISVGILLGPARARNTPPRPGPR